MKINKKINLFIILSITISFISFGLNTQKTIAQVHSTKKQTEFYLPKSFAKIPDIPTTKKPAKVKENQNTSKPVIKEKIKTSPDIKPKITPHTAPAIKHQTVSSVTTNTKISLSNFIKTFNSPYSRTFTSALLALSSAKVEVLSFNSLEGKIYAKLNPHKELYILVHSVNTKTSSVRITPANGIYDISDTLLKNIFDNINTNNFTDIGKKV